MQSATLSVGDPIETRCTKCRKKTAHTILSLAEGAPDKVECSLCNHPHKYRPPKTPTKSAPKKPVDRNREARKEWAALRPDMNVAKATDYSMTAAYKVRALINHPVFGLGLVQRVVGSQKVEVLFEDGKKTMRCK